eukprot:TRINITY_DN47098_c0_g1_i1.p1 TRINITY_DN47098_c0_g1~~TRINITY_DN47098_c0_g1_i1.p1  ORF type:complete len:454 (+),score=123.90 TRINITY_DN47098_c0_g1_i1:59-1420(+)
MAAPTTEGAVSPATLGRSIGRDSSLKQPGMRRQGETDPEPLSAEDRIRIARATFRTSNDYFPEEGEAGVGERVSTGSRRVLPSKEPRQLEPAMVNSIQPYPLPPQGRPARGAAGNYKVAQRSLGRPKKMHDLDYVNPHDKFTAQVSAVGRVPNGLPDSRGFIEIATEQQRRQAEAFSEDTLDEFRKGREKELELERQRLALKKSPLQSAPVDEWVTTNRADYVSLLPAVDRSAVDTCHHRPVPKPNASVIEREKAKGVKLRGNPTQYTGEFARRSAAVKDTAALTVQREKTSAEQRAQLEATKPRGSPWVGGPPRSTYKDDLREFDVKVCDGQMSGTATVPVVHAKYKEADPEADDFIAQVEHRKATRNEGDYATTVSQTLQSRLDEAEPTTFRRAHFFDRKNGCMQMPKRGDAPLRKATNDHNPKSMSDVNPTQFMTTKGMMERMALGGLKP